jgi:hypothetical protein
MALAQLFHCINTSGHQVTVHRDVVVKFLVIHATERLPVVVENIVIIIIIIIFILYCDVTNI